MSPSQKQIRTIKAVIFVICLIPLGMLIWDAFNASLGANPIETISHRTGDWTLRLLLVTLAVTPLRHFFGWRTLARLRRMFGLFAFFYACLHFLNYLVLDQFFSWEDIVADVAKRPYITVGFASFLMLIPLAVTSTDGMIRWLGGRRWQQLHRLVYAVGIGGVLHYLWLVKADVRAPLLYGLVLSILLGSRLWIYGGRRLVQRPAPASAGRP